MKIDIFNHLFPQRFFDEFINTPAGPKDIGKRVRSMPTIVDLDASVVRHSDATLSRVRRARVTFSRISEAFAVQMKGFGAWL